MKTPMWKLHSVSTSCKVAPHPTPLPNYESSMSVGLGRRLLLSHQVLFSYLPFGCSLVCIFCPDCDFYLFIYLLALVLSHNFLFLSVLCLSSGERPDLACPVSFFFLSVLFYFPFSMWNQGWPQYQGKSFVFCFFFSFSSVMRCIITYFEEKKSIGSISKPFDK